MTIGKVLKKYRKEKGMTQYELAELIAKTISSIKKYESGTKIPKNVLLDLCSVFDKAPIEFLSEINDIDEKETYSNYFSGDDFVLNHTPKEIMLLQTLEEKDGEINLFYKAELVDKLLLLGVREDIAYKNSDITPREYKNIKNDRTSFIREELYKLGFSDEKIAEVLEEE